MLPPIDFPSLLALLAALLPAALVQSESAVRLSRWYIPTRLTAQIPCLDERLLKPGRTMDQEHGTAALYRWVQENGNVIGSGFYQTVRLLRMPANHRQEFHVVIIACMIYDWSTEATITSNHEIHFFEGPTITAVASVGFKSRENFTNFVDYLGKVNFDKEWCLNNDMCIEVLVAPVRSPELEYPHLFDTAAAYNRTPLTDLLMDLRTAEATGMAPDFLLHVNFVIRLSLSARLPDLCNPQLPSCATRLLEGRLFTLMEFSESTVRLLNKFSADIATARKLKTPDSDMIDMPWDAVNFTLKLSSISVCPRGYGRANHTTMTIDNSYHHNGTTLVCLACPPGTHGSNGLNCFAVQSDFYTEDWGATEITPCPDYYVTLSAGASSKSFCTFNGTTPEKLIMEAMRYAWEEIETVFYQSVPGVTAILLIVYLSATAYALFWQLHRLITLMQYRKRRGMSDRLLKRFIAEAYLRDLRRMQYWRAALAAADAKRKPSVSSGGPEDNEEDFLDAMA